MDLSLVEVAGTAARAACVAYSACATFAVHLSAVACLQKLICTRAHAREHACARQLVYMRRVHVLCVHDTSAGWARLLGVDHSHLRV